MNLFRSPRHNGRQGLGYNDQWTTHREPRTTFKEPDTRIGSKTKTWINDDKRCKYVRSLELPVCFFCGHKGHKIVVWVKKRSTLAMNGKRVKQIWIRKDLLESSANMKGPRLIWVPKDKGWYFLQARWEKAIHGEWLLALLDQIEKISH